MEREEIHKMIERGIVEPSNSPWASNIVLVVKNDGKVKFCDDYRHLNDVTIKDAYPLPRVDECLDSLAGAKWFSSMDLHSGFWQIAMAPEDKADSFQHQPGTVTLYCNALWLSQFTMNI